MKKTATLLFMTLAALWGYAQTLPTFSTDGNEVWYYVQFKNAKAVLADQGEGANLLTANPAKVSTQLWKLVGRRDSFELVGKLGRHVYYNGTRFATSATQTGRLSLVSTTNAGYAPAWELSAAGLSGQSMNQWGGAGAGKQLGAYTVGDVNNPIEFVPQAEMEANMPPTALTEYNVQADSKYRPTNINTLWYRLPAINTTRTSANPWMEYALPIGDGQFGAMIHAGIRQDKVQFNDKTLWSGSSSKYGYYLNFGELYLENLDNYTATVRNYIRYLDLETATAGMHYSSPDRTVKFTREYIASHPARTVVIRLAADVAGKINQKFYLYNPNGSRATYNADGTASFSGTLDLVSYHTSLRVVPKGGTMTADETGISVVGADEVLVFLAGGTNYDATAASYTTDQSQLASTVEGRVAAASAQTWESLYAAHVADHKSYFDRLKLELTGAANEMETYALVNTYNGTAPTNAVKLMLEQLYFNYGRYMMIAASRGVDLPSNLQGIWNNSNTPPWHSDIHSNINVQMNYWPAEPLNLSELHKPFLNYIYNQAIVQPQWQRYARQSGQNVGWTCFTENNIFGFCTSFANNYVIANAWYSTHMWQHYRYTLDRAYLKDVAFPVMKSCTDYWLERLIKDRQVNDGTWVAPNEWSPEHGPNSEDATAHAQQLVWDLFNNTLKAIEILGADAGVTPDYTAALQLKFDSLDTGLHTEVENGITLLREWKYSPVTASGDRGHRHMSHLMALYPLNQVGPSSPYFQPIINSMNRRGDASTGWSMGWKINLWARALDGNRAHTLLKTALKHSTSYGTDQSQGGIYYNLFDSHAPFQIDGNFGATAGIGEMLMQSHLDTIQILPALPTAWASGYITGMRAVNNFGVDINWNEGRLTTATITSNSGQICMLSYPGISTTGVLVDENRNTITPTVINANTISFPTTEGGKYTYYTDATLMSVKSAMQSTSSDFTVTGRTITTAATYSVVYDLEGRQVLETSKSIFTVPTQAGKTVVLKRQVNGMVKADKIILH